MSHRTTYVDIRIRTPALDGSFAPQQLRPRTRHIPLAWYAVLIFMFTLATIGFLAIRARADEVVFTPRTCLGGWNNPANASGTPDLSTSDGLQFTEGNSASITNSLAEMYCGDFSGDIPKDTKPTAITVKFSWALVQKGAQTSISASVEDLASSTSDVLDAPADTVGTTGSTSTDATDTPQVSDDPSAPTSIPDVPPLLQAPVETSGASDDSSAISLPSPVLVPTNDSVAPAPASEQSAPAPVPDAAAPTSDPTSFLTPGASATPQASIIRKVLTMLLPVRAFAQEVTSSGAATSTTLDESVDAVPLGGATSTDVVAQDAILEVSYTLDGNVWHVLRTLSPADIASKTSLTIPVESISGWQDLAHLQIRVRTISSVDAFGTIYLDGMTLTAAYANISPSPDEVVDDTNATSTPKDNLPSEGDAGTVDRSVIPQGEYILASGARPNAFFEIYLLDDPDSAPDAGHVYGAVISDDGTLQIDTATLPVGAFLLEETTDPAHCGDLSLTECRASPGYIGEIPLTVSSSTVQ